MNIVTMKLADLHPIKKNVRRHTERQIVEYMHSLEMFQQVRPMVIDEENTILIGNGRYESMQRLGWEEADCQLVTGLTEAAKKKLMLADNRVYELGITDMDAFDEIIRELGDDLDVPGWDRDLLETLRASMPEADAMVENYGVFPAEEVSTMQERQREDHTALQPPTSPSPSLQRPPEGMQPVEQVSDRPPLPTPTDATEPRTGRFIICPHCGQRIEVTPDMIGGE